MFNSGIPHNYRLDGEANPLYWGPYRAMYDRLIGTLLTTPGMRLLQPECLQYGFCVISVLSKNQLEWNHFDFTSADRAETYFGLPIGKSAQIDFTGNVGLGPDEFDMNMVTDAILKRKAHLNDHLFGANIAGIELAGWQVHWTPLQQNPLHVQIIHQENFNHPSFVPKKAHKEKLVKQFWLIK